MCCAEMIDIALDASDPLDRSSNIPLAAEPGDQSLRQLRLMIEQCASIRSQYCGEGGCRTRDAGEALLHQSRGCFHQPCPILGGEAAVCQHLLLEREEPAINDAAKRALGTVGCGQA